MNSKKKKRVPLRRSLIFPFSFFFIIAPFCASLYAVEPIKIGLLGPPPSESGEGIKPYLWGAELAVSEVNAREGKQGIQFLLVLWGGKFDREKEIKALRKLILEERIHFLLGRVDPASILPVAELAKEQKIPFLVFPIDFLRAASTGKEPGNLFWFSPSPEAYQRAAVRTAVQFPQKRFFLLARDSASGKSWAKYFWETLQRLKPSTDRAGEIFLPEHGDNYGGYVPAILSSKAEICVSHLGGEGWIQFARAARKQGYFKKITHFELESSQPEILMALKKDAPEGVWGINTFPFWFLEGKESQDFVAKYRSKTGLYPGLEALSGYGSIYALLAAMKKSGSFEPEKVMEALGGLSFPTPVGALTIRKTDRRALWPIWCGISKRASKYPFPILKELKAFGPDSFLSPDQQEEIFPESSPK
jgi:branched-chain amino acid transport system substrate-binding protein